MRLAAFFFFFDNEASSLQAFKRVGPPNKVQEKNLLVDSSRALGYSGTNKRNIMSAETEELKRIADAIEEILRLIKKDMGEMKKAAK